MSKKQPTTNWSDLKKAFHGRHAKKANAILDDMDADEFMVNFFKLAEYCAPKLAREEAVTDENRDININISYVESEADREGEKGTDN